MKKTEIAAKVFETMDSLPLVHLEGGSLVVPISDLAGLALVPWFCDESVQWAIRITLPGQVLKKSLLKKVNDSYITVTEAGVVLIGIPGDGIAPSSFTLFPLADAVARVAQAGMTLELATANLGMVKRDWETRAETNTPYGNQRYFGTVDAEGRWAIQQSTPGLPRAVLETALVCGCMVAKNGPWPVESKAEARAVLMHWMQSRQANVNPMAVKRFITFQNGEFRNSDPGMVRLLHGLGLGFFRHRLPSGPFRWEDSGPERNTAQELEDVVRAVVG